ncbi:hypothetical protein [Metapseudomonas sp. CR1201]
MSLYQAPTEGDYCRRLEALEKRYTQAGDVELMFRLAHIGDIFSAENNWPLNGMDGVTRELIKRHNWTPSEIENLTPKQLFVALVEDYAAHSPTGSALNYLVQWLEKQRARR